MEIVGASSGMKQTTGKRGGSLPSQAETGIYMYTVSDILADIDRGCTANNMAEDRFSYRIIFYINEGARSTRHFLYAYYGNLRKSLEDIIKGNLSLTNSIVIAETTALKNGRCVRLQSRPYVFSLDGYFRLISGEAKAGRERRAAVSCAAGYAQNY